jgi:hypothetical protein
MNVSALHYGGDSDPLPPETVFPTATIATSATAAAHALTSDTGYGDSNTSSAFPFPVSTTMGGGGGRLSPMAVHFLVVGVLFVAVVILALVNAYLHFRSERRARLFAAAPPPVERTYSSRRRRSGRQAAAAAASAAAREEAERRTRMTMRMKPTKMFTV